MKIDGSRPSEVQDLQIRTQKMGKQESASGASEQTNKTGQSDQVHLSGKAREMDQLKEIINQMPEIRSEKIEALKKSIAEGSYIVDASKIAKRMIEEF